MPSGLLRATLPAYPPNPSTLFLSRGPEEWGEVRLVGERRNLGVEEGKYVEKLYPFMLYGFYDETFPHLSEKTSVECEFLHGL